MNDKTDRGGGDGGGTIKYPTLSHTNYTSWCIRVQAIMEDQGVWEVMEATGSTSKQHVASAEVAKAKDRKARAHLF
jgi:hypothetical protein